MEGDVEKVGLKSRSLALPQPGACGWPGQVLSVLPCRTATVWKTLCPFWGEEYQVYLSPSFHAVAFYVMDEDALRWVSPAFSWARHCHLPLQTVSVLGQLVALYSRGGAREGLEGCRV